MMRWICLVGLLSLTSACGSERATPAQCAAIFDRLVELELQEMGYNDPVLAARRTQELAARHRDELGNCVGRPLPANALICMQSAESAEELSHVCLR
jgi:hypothetical protein